MYPAFVWRFLQIMGLIIRFTADPELLRILNRFATLLENHQNSQNETTKLQAVIDGLTKDMQQSTAKVREALRKEIGENING